MSGFVSKNPGEVSQQKVHMKWLDAILKFFMANLMYIYIYIYICVCMCAFNISYLIKYDCAHVTNKTVLKRIGFEFFFSLGF